MPTSAESAPPRVPPKRENLLVNLICNIGLPFFILSKLSAPERLGPHFALVIALAFPLGYGLLDYLRRRTMNFVSIIGVISTLATGVFGLMKLDPIWFAVKEAAVPVIVALGVLASMKSRRPLINQFLYNEQVINVPKVEAALASRDNLPAFAGLLRRATYLVVLSFLLSAALNYFLARWIITSTSGSEEFNAQLAKMTALSWPVIVLPSMIVLIIALWLLLRGITRLTGMPFEEIFHPQPEKKKKTDAAA